MDPIVNWYGGVPHPHSRFGRFTTDETLSMCAELGAVSMDLIGQPTHDASLDLLATSFAAVCERAAELGAQAHLEFTPISAIRDLAAGWDIVCTADRPNGGLLFDTWHFFRSRPDLAAIPAAESARLGDARVRQVVAAATTTA